MTKSIVELKVKVDGSGSKPYEVSFDLNGKPVHCTCPSWRFKKVPAEQRTCKHYAPALKKLVGAAI